MTLSCRQFERAWQRRLDARGPAPVQASLAALDAHAATCPRCATIHAGYRRLGEALARPMSPAIPVGFADRVLAAGAPAPAGPPTVLPILGVPAVRAAIAATVFLAVGAASWLTWPARPAGPLEGPALVGSIEDVAEPAPPSAADPGPGRRPLDASLADLTSATITLARATSIPAARLGRSVLAGDGEDEGETPAVAAEGTTDGDDLLRRLGDGVRPISGPARHAFGFLLGSPPPDAL